MSSSRTATKTVVDLLRADTAHWRSPRSTDTSGVVVYESAEVHAALDNEDLFVVIGYPGKVDSPGESEMAERRITALSSSHPRQDDVVIHCLASGVSQDVMVTGAWALRTLLDQVDTLVDLVDQALRTSPNMGLTSAQFRSAAAWVSRTSSTVYKSENSVWRNEVDFDISVTARPV